MSSVMSAGQVYTVRNAARGYKIGRTFDLAARLYGLNEAVGERLNLVHAMTCDDAVHVECFLHRRYFSERLGDVWFRLADEDVQELKAIGHVPDGPLPEIYEPERPITLSCQAHHLNRAIERPVVRVNRTRRRYEEKYRKQDAIRGALELFIQHHPLLEAPEQVRV